MRLSTCGSVVMFQPPDLPDPGTPADPGSLLPWEHAALTLRKAHRIADRSYFGHGPEDKAGRSGHADGARAKATFSEPPRHPALARSDANAAGNRAPVSRGCWAG